MVLNSVSGASPRSIQPRCGSTGPPIQRRRSLPVSMGGSSRTMLVAGMSVGRLITRPNAPSGVKSHSSTTALAKFGSCSWGIDSSKAGRNGSDIIFSSSAAIRLSSPTKRRNSVLRLSSSGARRIDEGCTVAITRGASGEETNAPRRCETLKARPSSACAAVAPRHRITRGLVNAISVSSHGRQAAISAPFGLAWMRRLPRGSHLKCFTTLVRYTRARSIPASASARSSSFPAGPTNG